MIKTLFVSICLLLVLSLCGCAQNAALHTSPTSQQEYAIEDTPAAAPAAAPNTISAATLTDREELLAAALMGNTFVFDYNVDENYQYVRLWVRAYAFGKEVEDQYTEMLHETDPSGTMIFSLHESPEEEGAKITLCAGSYSQHSGGSQSETGLLPSVKYDADVGEAYGVPSITLPSSGNTALAYVRSYSGNFDDGIDNKFFIDYRNQLHQIANDDLTYVFGCAFFTEKP